MTLRTPARHRASGRFAYASRWLVFALIYSTTMGQPRDINEVLASYKKQLMSTADVVGVYVGLCEDHRTECIHVMTRRDSPELRRTIPKTLDTYPVVIEISGDVRPLAK